MSTKISSHGLPMVALRFCLVFMIGNVIETRPSVNLLMVNDLLRLGTLIRLAKSIFED